MTCVIQDKSPSLNDPKDFFHAFHNSPSAIKNFLCKFFLYNFAVPNNRDWNPLIYVCDIQLRALMSWIQNEIRRVIQDKYYRELKVEMSLLLRAKAKDPKTYYYDWLNIAPFESSGRAIYPFREATFYEYK